MPGAELKSGDDYYDGWLRTLENLLMKKGAASARKISDTAEAWRRAAHATPHGQPILLKNDLRR